IRFLTLLKNDIKLFFKDWKAVILLLVMPVLFIALFIYVLTPYINKTSFVDPFPVALVDKEDTAQTRVLSRQLDEIELFSEVLRVNDSEARELLGQNRAAAEIIIPQGFSESILSGENKPVTVIGNKAMPLQAYVAKNVVQTATDLLSASESALNTIDHFGSKAGINGKVRSKDYDDSMTQLLINALSRKEIFSEVQNSSQFDLTPAEYFTSGLIIIFLMFAGMPAMKMLVWERNYGISRRLASTPAKPYQIILSKFIVSILLSILQFAVIVAATAVFFHNYWGAPLKNILYIFAAIILAVSAWSVFVSAISKTTAAADAIGNLGILLMAVVGGSIYPLSSMPDFIKSISKFTINRWAMDGFMVLFSGDNSLSVTGYALPLLAIGGVLLVAALGVMKVRGRG
ncbi:MAG: ABC transporter permease, partial [Bacillota bacterium]|nr:ABC transporter permease [Bacillota bacterium]